MKFILSVISLLLISFPIFSQNIEKYSGTMHNGISIKGNVKYSFYRGKNNKNIKHGPFRYSAREKNNKWRYSHNISGNYKDGLKNGEWSYSLDSKSFKKDKDNFFYDIELEMQANYKDGYTDGRWEYLCNVIKYKKVLKSGRYRKTNKQTIEDIRIVLNWNKGILIDSLIINDKEKTKIIATMNAAGILNGSLTQTKKDNIIQWNYDNGVEINYKNGASILNNPEYVAYMEIKNSKSKSINEKSLIKKAKRSLLYDKQYLVKSYIDKHIFNDEYFLYRYIDGDKAIKSKLKYGDYTTSYKGLYFYKLSPVLTAEEKAIIKDIVIAHEKTKEALWFNNRELKKYSKDSKLLADRQRINNALKKYKFIDCHIHIYRKYISLKKLTENTECGKLILDKYSKKRIDYLNELKTISDKEYGILKIHNQFH